MYILVIARGYPSEDYKTYGIFEFDQAKALVEAGCKVVYAAVDLRSIRRWRKWGVVKNYKDGVDMYAINIPLGRFPSKIVQKIGELAIKKLYNKILLDHGRPDILHAHFYWVASIGAKLKDKIKIPLVITEHFSGMMNPKIDKKVFDIAQWAYKKSDAIVGVSPALVQKIDKEFKTKSIYVPNIVDTKLFVPNYEKRDNIFRFISIGALTNRKRMSLTIEAFNKAFKNDGNVTLTIFGEGAERKQLEALVSKYNLSTKVKLMGLRSRLEISNYLNTADCFVLASEFETFGVVYIESLAAGVPVIATKCGGPEGFINDENGILIDVDNEEQLINAMKYMYSDENKFNRRQISQQTSNQFSAKTVSHKLIEIYKNIMQ